MVQAVATTQETLDGRLVSRGDADYETTRQAAVWNSRKPERYPDAILLAGSDEDVAAGVRLARERGMRVSVRSGGHSWIGGGVRDGGLLIDLSALQEVTVDPDSRIATVRPATRSRDLDAHLVGRGLFFPTGHAPTVGIGGFTIGGGYGWNSRTFGPACLSIQAIDVVLADGSLVHADDDSHPELLWAVRGAGPGFFGVVTRLYLRVYPRHSTILRSAYVFPRELRDELLVWSYETLPSVPASVEMSIKVGYVDGIDDQVTTLTAAAFCPPEAGREGSRDGGSGSGRDAGRRLLAQVESCPFIGRELRSIVARPVELTDMYDVADGLTPAGLRWSVDGIWCDSPIREVVGESAPIFDGIPSRRSFVFWMLWGGYPTRADACWSAQAPLYLSPNAGCEDPADDLRHEDWVHGSLGRLGHLSRGTQCSDANPGDRPDRVLSPESAARLEELRGKFDPEGLFHSYLSPAESTTSLGRANQSR